MLLSELIKNKRTAVAFKNKKIITDKDLLETVPRKYHDYRFPGECTDFKPGDYAALKGILTKCELRHSNGRKYLYMRLRQEDHDIAVLSFNNIYLQKIYESYLLCEVVICGKLAYDQKFGYSIGSPEIIELAVDFRPRIVPIYPKYKGISEKTLRTSIKDVLGEIKDPLPEPVLEYLNEKEVVPGYKEALLAMHYPKDPDLIEAGKKRLVLNDLLYFASELRTSDEEKSTRAAFPKKALLQTFIDTLPFELTEDQKKAIETLQKKTYRGERINALVQGDVGCGKTLVATAMMINAAESGFQSVLMAPRQALAMQHYEDIRKHAEPLGIHVAFLHSGLRSAERKKILQGLQSGIISIAVGTQSCISEDVQYRNLGLVITDEEHLFGAKQKEALKKRFEGLHSILMTATPLPRSLALTIFGENTDIIEIHSMPKGRIPIQTAVQRNRNHALPFALEEIRKGHQCYVVCPSIEESEDHSILSLEEAEMIYRDYFSPYGIKIGVLNGKMNPKEISETLQAFSENRIQVLLSTTVIEVGINVPSATVIIIENAERFGCASLHQLRGRVGRSHYQSYCILISTDPENERLQVLCRTTDGFEIAEQDMRLRGTGSLIGDEQSGFDRYVNLMLLHRDLFALARETAKKFVKTGYLDRLKECYEEHSEYAEGA